MNFSFKLTEQNESETPTLCAWLQSVVWCFPLLPAGEFGGEFGEKVAGSTAAGLRQRGGIMGEGGRGRRPVVRGRAAVSQLAPVEGAAAGGASWEAQSVRRGGVGDAVDRRHRVPLAAGRHGDTAEVEEEERKPWRSNHSLKPKHAGWLFSHCGRIHRCIHTGS